VLAACAGAARDRAGRRRVRGHARSSRSPAPRSRSRRPSAYPRVTRLPAAARGGTGYSGPLPAHCRVDGVLERRKGVGGVEYGIRFALAFARQLDWTVPVSGWRRTKRHRQFAARCRGSRQHAGTRARGFAVVSTDTGHQGVVFDGSFFADQEATLNFLYVANGKVTQVAKRLIDAYYRKPAEHSYFVGCSTGGREAMIMSERYPSYFDGLVSGAPAMRTGYSNLGMRSVSVALSKAAAHDASGRRDSRLAHCPSATRNSSSTHCLKTCDADDGVADGMLFNPRACGFDPTSLVCKGAKSDSCLSAAQAAAVKTALSGPKASNGRQVYPGYLYDTGITFGGQGIPGVLNGAPSPVGPRVPPTTQDVDAEAATVVGEPSTLGDTNQWTSLSSFSGHGGKLLFYHGGERPMVLGARHDRLLPEPGRQRTAARTRCGAGAGCSSCPAWGTAAAARPRSTALTC